MVFSFSWTYLENWRPDYDCWEYSFSIDSWRYIRYSLLKEEIEITGLPRSIEYRDKNEETENLYNINKCRDTDRI